MASINEYPYDDGLIVPIGLVEEVVYRFQLLSRAKNLGDQAEAFTQLANEVFQLQTWHPGFDDRTGTMPWEREDEEYA